MNNRGKTYKIENWQSSACGEGSEKSAGGLGQRALRDAALLAHASPPSRPRAPSARGRGLGGLAGTLGDAFLSWMRAAAQEPSAEGLGWLVDSKFQQIVGG